MRTSAVAAGLWLAIAITAHAQEPTAVQLPRWDGQISVGWQNLHEPNGISSNDWLNDIGLLRAAGGWYWTEHLRLFADAAMASTGTQYRIDNAIVGGQLVFVTSRLYVRSQVAGFGAQYQFGHNAWFHPHVGAGALVTVERRSSDVDATVVYDPRGGTRELLPSHRIGPVEHTTVSPFVDLGFKSYVSQRAYFVHDTRFVASKGGVQQIGFNFGFGLDF